MQVTAVIGISFLVKIREIFIFNIMFTAFIKILPVGELPAHTHSASTNTTGEHTHTYTFKRMSGSDSSPSRYASSGDPAIYQSSSSGSHSHSVTVNSIGSNQPHNNMQPFIVTYIWQRIE